MSVWLMIEQGKQLNRRVIDVCLANDLIEQKTHKNYDLLGNKFRKKSL